MGILLKLVIVLILARMLVGVLRYLMRGSQPRPGTGQGPARDKGQRARQQLDGDIVDAEFEDITDKHKQG